MKNQVICLLMAAATVVTAEAQTTNTIDFTTLGAASGLSAVNAKLGSFGFLVDAGYPNNLSLGGSGLTFYTDPGAGDVVFDFSAPVSLVSVNYGVNSGAATGLWGLSLAPTAAAATSLPSGDLLDYSGSSTDVNISRTVTSTSPIYGAWIEDEGVSASLRSITFVTVATPEPATLALFGMGALVVASRCRRAAK